MVNIIKDYQHHKRNLIRGGTWNKHDKKTDKNKTKRGGNMFDQVHDHKMTITTRRRQTQLKKELEQGGGVYTTIINKYDQKTKHNREGGVQLVA